MERHFASDSCTHEQCERMNDREQRAFTKYIENRCSLCSRRYHRSRCSQCSRAEGPRIDGGTSNSLHLGASPRKLTGNSGMAAGERTRDARFCRRGYAHAIKIDAMRLLGGFMKAAEKRAGARGRSGGGTRVSRKAPQPGAPPTGEVTTEGLGKGRETGQRYQFRSCRV